MTIMKSIISPKKSSGFTVLELIVVIAIIGIGATIIYAAMNRYVPGYRVRSEAMALDAVFQKARLRAATSQKPVRVVLNCLSTCTFDLQVATYNGPLVNGWVTNTPDHHVFEKSVTAKKRLTNTNFDGNPTAPNIFWAIFMPDSRVYSNPRPFEIFIFPASADLSMSPDGWRISLSNDAGRISTEQTKMTGL